MSNIQTKHLQHYLNQQGENIKVDNLLGPKTYAAMRRVVAATGVDASLMDQNRLLIYVTQLYLASLKFYDGKIDGFYGPTTGSAIEKWQTALTNTDTADFTDKHTYSKQPPWPLQSAVPAFFGPLSTIPSQLETFAVPYDFILSWDPSTTVSRITMHKKVKQSVLGVLENVVKNYDKTSRDVLGLSSYGGSYSDRKMRGGSKPSMHAYGIAIDIDPVHNGMRDGPDKARFAVDRADYVNWFAAWDKYGWTSLGQARGFDYMHYQAARLWSA